MQLHRQHTRPAGLSARRCCALGATQVLPSASGLRRTATRMADATRCQALPSLDDVRALVGQYARQAAAGAGAALCAGSLLLAPPALSDENSGTTVIRLPASEDPTIFVAQQTMVQAWQIVGESFFDGTFAGHNWTDELRSHMLAAYQSVDGSAAYHEISTMLADLGDPYTRLLPPDEYQDFVVSSNGELQGVGMLIANEPVEGHLLVLAPIKGSPADRAGIKPGDILMQINGQDTNGWTGEEAAHHLRGQGGTQVHVRLVRHTDQIPGVPGRPPPAMQPVRDVEVEVSLTRETVSLSPVFYAALPGPTGRVGYVKLAAFSQNAGDAVRDAIHDLQEDGVTSMILDLRSNPGGLVQSAAEVARLFLDGHPTLFTVSGRAGEQLQEVALDDGTSVTHAPLAVLVDHGSASASEILSGALHDNHRAIVIGDEKTYGKGRIQSVFEMDDGSALFVTVARYQTPSGYDIDLRGINPDMACTPPIMGASRGSRHVEAPPPSAAVDYPDSMLPEIDRCLLTAMNVLADPSGVMQAQVATR